MTNKEKLVKDFKDVKLIFQKAGVRFFSIKGTCLGSIRNADFIEWDTNIDQAIFSNHKEWETMKDLLTKEGFTVTEIPDHIKAIRNTTVNIYKVLEDDKGLYVKTSPQIYFKKENLDTLVSATLGDQFCFTQANPVEHLVDLYGQNWATPKQK